MRHFDVAIVGTGHGGAQAAIALRQHGFTGSLALIGREADLPYERPPLSKEYLAGDRPFDRLLIRPPVFWDDRDVIHLGGRDVVAVGAGRLVCASGEMIGFERLVWAAGGQVRRLDCPGADRVHYLRDKADADRLRSTLPLARRVLVIGGGYVGLEAAAVLRGLGKMVTLVEAAPRLLPRVAGASLSAYFAALHQSEGVALRLGRRVTTIDADGAVLDDGARVAADLVVAGIGIEPATGSLIAAGAAGSDGVDVDAFCRTSLSDVYAVGDCAAHPSVHAGGRRIRIESVQNAHDMATTAARHLLGDKRPYRALPWFWSNQYDLRLQTVGLSGGHDQEVLRGDPAMHAFSVLYLRKGRVIALDCVNTTRDYAQGRRLIESGAIIPQDRLADTSEPLKAMV